MAEKDDQTKGFDTLGSLSEIGETAEKQVKELADKVSGAVDGAINAASQAVRSGTVSAQQEAEWAASRARQFYDTGLAHWKATEEQAVGYVREGVQYALEHQEAATAGAVGAALVLLPGPRGWVVRKVLKRFRSQEAVFRNAELRNAQLADRLSLQASGGRAGGQECCQAEPRAWGLRRAELWARRRDRRPRRAAVARPPRRAPRRAQSKEVQRLEERVAAARAEYERGLSKLKAASSELQSLGGRVRGAEKSAHALITDLRELPSKAALQMRSDVAQKASAAAGQRSAIEKLVRSLAKQGI
eukprot:scaffold20.g7703.t1